MADSVTEILLRARGDFSDLTGKISGLRKEFQNLKLPKDITANLEKGFNRLDPILKSYQKQLDKGFKTKTDLKNFEATRHELDAIFGDITSEIQKVNGQPVQLKANLKEIDALDKKLNKLGEDLQKKLNNISIDKGNKVTQGLDKIVESAKKASTIKPMTIKAQALFDTQDFAAYNSEIDKMQNKILSLSNKSGAKIDLARALGFKGETFTKEGEAITSQIERVDTLIKNFFNSLKVSDHAMGGLEKTNAEIVQTGEALNKVKTDSLEKGVQALSDFGANAQQASQQAKGLGDSIDGAASSSVRMADELQQLKTSTQYFFSLRNMLNLFKRGVQEAVDVIKELDAAMTETAVVTDFSVGDMWKKLPEYTANANALGASVKDMYKATTLYYQQGLETDAAMGIANETMKMARIGGLDAADATDKMTAALRGFNMTLDETSAQRVNDVYSNLAAKTASNTEELGTAMQRTASIAASAGMSFEGTAAFLAQAIETTREPAENLGTAMKTIVARFTELKKNPLEISEVDGEEVDYNKVDAALKSIGVSLKDANGQFRNLDQVFLDIAQRWDGLTQTQQRYVATQAAGSRQQSRFIAMMSNYERTVELMDYANNSAGASNEQFGKTMESLEAKLNKLKNAWNEFLMGIMNDSMTKFVVDAGTKLLGLLNDITDALSFGGKSGLLKSITSLTAAFIGLKTAGKLINFGVDKIGGLLNPNTPLLGFGGGHGEKVSKTTTTIVNPIVAEIRQVVAAIKGQSVVKAEYDKIGTVQQYKDSQANLRTLLGLNDKTLIGGAKVDSQRNIKYSQITDNLKGLGNDQQRQLLGALPGLQQAMRGATLDLLKNNNISKNSQKVGQQITKDIIQGMNKGTISVEKGIDLLRNPQKWGQTFGNKFNAGNLQEIANSVTSPEFNKLVEEAQDKYAQAIYRGQNADRTWLTDEEIAARQADFEKYAKRKSKDKAPIEDIDYTKYSQLGDKIGQVGANFAVAGQSVQQFGMTLSNLGLEKAGALLMQIGSSISSLGMAFNGLGTILPKIQERFADAGAAAVKAFNDAGKGVGGAASGGGAFFSTLFGSGAAAAAAGIGVAVVAAVAIQKYLEKKAKEAGEEVRKQFEEKFTKADEKINSLEGYESRFNELAKGVDQFGHNVSLTSEEYDEYLSISRELQQLSPSLIAGYNAEGEAIIKKGSAIQDVINKLKEEKQAELDLFTSNTSIDKLIGEYETSDTFKEYNWNERGHITRGFDEEKTKISKLKDSDLDFKIVDAINQLSGWNLDSLNNLTTTQLSWLSKHYNDVINLVEEQNGALEDEVREGYVDAFTNAGSAINDVMTEGKPIIDAMQMWMGDQKLDAIGLGLGEEFSNSFNQGVEGIMLTGLTEGWTSDQFKTNLKDYANEWKHLAGSTSQYADILANADEIQQQYLDHVGEEGAIADYENDVEGLALQLEQLAEQYKGTGAAGEAFAEQCLQQAGALRNYATEGALSLGEALNTLSDEFESARGAKERFDKAIEGGDYYTAAEGYKGIIDTMLDEKNLAGDGSMAFWAGADELLGQEYVDNNSYDDIVTQVQKIQDCFADGADGIIAFNDLLTENADKLEGLGHVGDNGFEFDLQNEDLEEYAKVLHMSEDALASLIDKARQWTPINLGNPGEIRKAIENSEYSMAGTSTKGENLVYTSESQFRTEARQQGIRGDDYDKTKTDAEERGVRFLNVENLTAKNGDGLYADQVLENIGLKGADKTLNNAVAAFAKMGFDLEDTKSILTSDGIKLANGEEATAENIEKAYNEQAYTAENPTVAGIASNTDTLVSNTSAMLAAMGILTDGAKQDIENNTSNDTIKGYTDLLSKDFKTTSDRDNARAQVQAQRDSYQETIDLYARGGLTADNNEYIAKLVEARDKLTAALDNEATSWQTKIGEYSTLFTNLSNDFVNEHAVDFANAFAIDDIMQSADALRQLEDEGKLTYTEMRTLAAEFMQLNQADLLQLDSTQLDDLCTKLGLTKTEATALLDTLSTPFSLEGRLTGENLENYIEQYEGLDETEKTIFLRTDVSGEDKAEILIDKINNEFGDDDEKKKAIIIEATAKMANGDQAGAEKVLANAGFKEDEVKTITQKLSILVNGSVANPDEVKAALQKQLNGLELTANADVNIKANVGKQISNIGTSVNVNTQAIDDAKTKADRTKGTMTVDANTDKAKEKINNLRNIKDATITVNAKKGTGWVQNMTVIGNARGRNYSIPASQSLSFGSAAQGMNIPKKKQTTGSQMTSLVGEEGFEIGYMPSEQRSVIFGANGPEMTSFPSDTVIYPHKQSQEILRRGKGNHKSLGSFVGGRDSISSGGLLSKINNSSGNSNSYAQKVVDNAKAAGDKVAKNSENTAKAIARVLVWWDNHSRIADAIQRKTEQNQNTYEKYLKKIEATLSETGSTGQGDQFIANTHDYIREQETQYNRATDELGSMTQAAAKTNKGRKKQYKNGANNVLQVSYKKGKKQKTAYVDTSKYIAQDASGAYVINQGELNKIKNKDKRKQVADALNKEINDRLAKQKAAEDNMRKAQEALEKFSEELYESFFAWEIELTKIQNITQKIEALTSKIARKDAMENLLNAQVTAGADTPEALGAQLLQNFTNRLQDTQETIAKRRELIDETALDLQKKATGKNIQDQIATVTRNLGAATSETERMGLQKALEKLQDDQKVFEAVQKYAKYTQNPNDGTYSVDFNSVAFEQDKLAGKLSGEMGKAIQEFVKELQEGSKGLDDLYKTQREDLAKLYTTLNDLNDQWADYEKQLVEINEEANKKELDEVKKLSDSLKKSMDELLAEVKKRLEERRKIDDNRKTEQDISQKQQRLAALRADTSGGHQVEIAQLEKEIAEAQNNYQRTLEDQLLERLQNQADEASKQRERQIEIQESLLSGVNNIEEVQKWMAAPEQYKNEILERYRRSEGYYDEDKGEAQKAQIDRKFASFYTDMLTNRDKKTSIMEAISDNEIETINQKEADKLKLTNRETAKKFDDARTQLENLNIHKGNYTEAQASLNSLHQQWDVMSPEARALTNFNSEQDIQQRINDAKSIHDTEEAARLEQERKNREAAEAAKRQELQNNYNKAIRDFQFGHYGDMHEYGFSIGSDTRDAAEFYEKILRPLGKQLGYGPKEILTTLADKMGWDRLFPIVGKIHKTRPGLFDMDRLALTFQSSKEFQQAFNKSAQREAELWNFYGREKGIPYNYTYYDKNNKKITYFDAIIEKALRRGLTPYKTGGLANYTGPAWLDGTPSKPELVLNATDTKNFLGLRDVLSSAMKSTSAVSNSYGGDIMYDINIHVDKIEKDYDVDRVVDKVKKEITKGAGYRNVTQVRNFR